LKSEGKYKFTYGKRFKLTGGGTHMIWMLGSDYATNTWPGCGEIDIMEHKGMIQCYSWYSCIIQGVPRKMEIK
jgi:hypothetical protein